MVLWCDFMAGWISGMGGLLVGHPIDTIKVRQQINGTLLLEATKNVYESRGLAGFYRGMAAPMLSNGAMNSVFFGFYTGALDLLRDRKALDSSAVVFATTSSAEENTRKKTSGAVREMSYTDHFVAGCVGGIAQLTLGCPVDLVKVQLQGRLSPTTSTFRGPIDCILNILRTNGIPGLYKGLIAQAYRDIPASGGYFVVYEFCKRRLSIGENNPKFAYFMAGGIAGMLSWWSILPLDVIKSRIQADSHENPRYKGFLHCAKYIFRTEGLVGFFRGFLPLSIRAFPVNGTTFVIYEYLHSQCKEQCRM